LIVNTPTGESLPLGAALAQSGAGMIGGVACSDLECLARTSNQTLRCLEERVAVVRDWLPQFDRVVATTANASAVMTEIGVYADVSFCGAPLVAPPDRISLRLAPSAVRMALALDAHHGDRLPPSLQLFDRHGAVLHKTFMTSIADELALESLKYATRSYRLDWPTIRALEPAQDDAAPVEIGAIRRDWSRQDFSVAIDRMIEWRGGRRRRALPFIGADQAWRIDRQVAPHFLNRLVRWKTPFTRMVASANCCQLQHGALDDVSQRGDLFLMTSGRCTLSFDPADIADYWVTVHEGGLAIEAYDRDGLCAFALTQASAPQTGCAPAWQDVVRSLPRL